MNHTDLVLKEFQVLDSLVHGGKQCSILLTGRDLTIPQIVFISRHPRNASTDVSSSAIQSMERSLNVLEQRIRDGDIIYGVNTGFGGSADLRTRKFVELQRALIRELHYGVLPHGPRDHHAAPLKEPWIRYQHDLFLDGNDSSNYLPWSWARAAILIRINSLVSGCSAVRPVIVERMQDLLQYDIIPMIPMRGSISSSGDLSPLSYITGVIQGKPTIRILSRGHEAVYADTAFANAGLEPVTLQAKEGLAMTNGTAVSAAAASLALHDTHCLAIMAQVLTAMTVEALTGTAESFHPFFSETRPHTGQIESARNILAFLTGSRLIQVNKGAESSLRQDRYSIRTAPQWLGPILEDLVLAHQQITVECNSATDNPLVTTEGEVLHGGNFQAKSVTSAMEKTRQGIQGIGRMLFSQCTELINPSTSNGLPPNLIAEDPSTTLIFKGTDLNIAALSAELGFLANPVNHVQTAEMGNQSLNSLALISARYTHTANEVLSQLMAAHLIAVCQALDLRACHIQFLDMYRAPFLELVHKHYGTTDGHNVSSRSPQPAPDPLGELAELLWSQLLKSFGTTASLDAEERFSAIAKSLRFVPLDHPQFNTAAAFVSQLESFTQALSLSMKEMWCSHRDAYLSHGDANPMLGNASKAVYTFLRQTLKVPLLATRNIRTPAAEDLNMRLGTTETQAPTVGSYTAIVYRALRDGSLAKVAIDILKSCL